MIDLLPGVTFSDIDKQVYGSIVGSLIGAAVGALLGASTTFFISTHTRRKEIEIQKIRENKKIIKDDGLACRLANTFLMGLVVKNAANRQYAKDVSRGIMDEQSNNAVFQINTPFAYPDAPELTNSFVNENILALWSSLKQEIDLQNNGISSFNNYYDLLRGTVHSQVFIGEQANLNRDAIESDNDMIISAMESQQRANESFRTRCIRFLATLQCYNKYYLSYDLKDSTSLEDHRNVIDKLVAYEPRKAVLERSIKKVETIYADAGLFESEAYSARDTPPRI